ncbi:hypothetical protein [Micrococcus luteus]|uniref:hypothetical protein n=1 Tax=Micrococcus luteus TaxID=1270 RepID=UPI0033A49D68
MTAVSMFLAFCSLIFKLAMMLVRLVILAVLLTVQGIVWCCVAVVRLLNGGQRLSATR